MTKAVRIDRPGGPEAMTIAEVTLPPPGPGEARVRHTAIGLNFIDVYHRSGLYPLPALPGGLGLEAAGVVEAVGEGVTAAAPRQRVAYAAPPPGSYAEARNIAADRLVPLPDDIDDRTAAAMMLKGMTAEYLLRRTFRVTAGQTILFHAAAGGVGLIACQWAKALGATVIGTVSTPEKAALAAAHGCDYPVVTADQDFVAAVETLTEGARLPVVYDSVGKDTFLRSLACLARRGTLVSFGQSSGPVPPFDIGVLGAHGSLYLTRPSLMDYTVSRDELLASAGALFEVVRAGKVRIEVNQTYPLAKVVEAHRDLEGRRTTGSSVLIP